MGLSVVRVFSRMCSVFVGSLLLKVESDLREGEKIKKKRVRIVIVFMLTRARVLCLSRAVPVQDMLACGLCSILL